MAEVEKQDEKHMAFAKWRNVMHCVNYHNELTARVQLLRAKLAGGADVESELDWQQARLEALTAKFEMMFPVDVPQIPGVNNDD